MTTRLLVEELEYLDSPSAHMRSLSALRGCVCLDSAGGSHGSRFDILSALPNTILVNPSQNELKAALEALGPTPLLPPEWKQNLPFIGGLVGYFNYEYLHDNKGIASRHSTRRSSHCGVYDWALIRDHRDRRALAVFLPSCPTEKIGLVLQALRDPNPIPVQFHCSDFRFDISLDHYRDAFDKIHRYIYAGDCYQINYAQHIDAEFSGSALAAYLHLRQSLPGPYSAYLDLSDDKVLSFSPECFVTVDEGLARTRPIKGTAPRGATEIQDRELAKALQQSEKNRAENVMIVDLLRNDFSIGCKPHSVQVPELFALESFANVHHLVSTVVGELAAEVSPIPFMLQCFPGGSITGAPKLRAMQIIDELETRARNIYCGSIFYQSLHGRLDSNVAIRTLLVHDDKIDIWGGGGIVADSNANDEYEESIKKIDVLLQSLISNSGVAI